MQEGSNATFESVDLSDGQVRLDTIRKVRGHPLWVSVSVPKDAVYQGSLATL